MKRIKACLTFLGGLVLGFMSLHVMLKLSTTRTIKPSRTTTRPEHAHAQPAPGGNLSSLNVFSQPPRILCWIMTGPKNLESRTRHVQQTWARRCDVVLYMSSVESDFPTVRLNVSEGRENLYWKTIRALQHIHQNYLDRADWFLKADDDTFVVVDNLRLLLSGRDPEQPLYLGRRFRPFISQGYMSGGAGYVLSKEALRRFITGFRTGACSHFSEIEDMALGKCMETMKVEPTDSRDVRGRQTFHPFPPDHYLVRQQRRPRPWFLIYDHYPPIEGPGCCSDFVVSFHYIYAVQMYKLEYLTHHLRPYGYKYRFNPEEADNSTAR